MKFITHCSSASDRAYEALEFLKEAYANKKLNDIENMEEVFEVLDIALLLEEKENKLKEFHIE